MSDFIVGPLPLQGRDRHRRVRGAGRGLAAIGSFGLRAAAELLPPHPRAHPGATGGVWSMMVVTIVYFCAEPQPVPARDPDRAVRGAHYARHHHLPDARRAIPANGRSSGDVPPPAPLDQGPIPPYKGWWPAALRALSARSCRGKSLLNSSAGS